MTAGALLRDTARTLAAIAGIAIPFAILVDLPMMIVDWVDPSLETATMLARAFVGVFVDGVIFVLADRALRGRPLALGEAARLSISAYPRLFLTSMIAQLMSFVFALLLVVGGVWRATTYAIATPIALHEDRLGRDACDHSAQRIKGHVLPTLAAFLPFVVLSIGLLAGPYLLEDSYHQVREPLPGWMPYLDAAVTLLGTLTIVAIGTLQGVLYERTRAPSPAAEPETAGEAPEAGAKAKKKKSKRR